MTPEEVRSYIQEAMLDREMTHARAGKLTGVGQPNVSRYIHSEPKTVPQIAFKLLEALGLELCIRPKADH
jgi:predicted transcriptional regulator